MDKVGQVYQTAFFTSVTWPDNDERYIVVTRKFSYEDCYVITIGPETRDTPAQFDARYEIETYDEAVDKHQQLVNGLREYGIPEQDGENSTWLTR